MATLEEAQRCPKCEQPGKEFSSIPIRERPGWKALIMQCENEHCRWYNTRWAITVRADGTIAEYKEGPKQYQGLSPSALAAGQRMVEDALQRDHRED